MQQKVRRAVLFQKNILLVGRKGYDWKDFVLNARFQLLIKSMSKIDNKKIDHQNNQTENNLSTALVLYQRKVAKIEQKMHQQHIASNQTNLLTQRDKQKEDDSLKFSRFQHWDLISMSKNKDIVREKPQNEANDQKNLQQLNQQSHESEFLQITPMKPYSNGLSEKKTVVHYSSDKKQAFYQGFEQKKFRPKQKGLRKLSKRAFEIVKQLGEATYKQVANQLIKYQQNYNGQPGQAFQKKQQDKQQNNIKRRVYDALNVLIALDFLHKRGRNIVYQQKYHLEHQFLSKKLQKQKIAMACSQKIELIRQKKEQILRLKIKCQAMKNLIERNNTQKCQNQQNMIKFPFVCLMLQSNSINTLCISHEKGQFKVITKDDYSFLGDLDFLLNHPGLKN